MNYQTSLRPPLFSLKERAEMQELTEFWNSDRRIFAFYGVAQMGKSFTINKWIETILKNQDTHQITLTEDRNPVLAFYEKFGLTAIPTDASDFIHKNITKKVLLWFENTETMLQLKSENKEHKLNPQFYELLKELAKFSHIKIVVESRYDIRLTFY